MLDFPQKTGFFIGFRFHKKLIPPLNAGDPLSASPAASSGMFNCEVCGKALKGKDSLRDHMLIHDGPR